MEAAVIQDKTIVERLDIPAPLTLWANNEVWANDRRVIAFVMVLAASRNDVMAERSANTTLLAITIEDVLFWESKERDPDAARSLQSFSKAFVFGVCPQGAKIFRASGQQGGYTLLDDCREKERSLLGWAAAEQSNQEDELNEWLILSASDKCTITHR